MRVWEITEPLGGSGYATAGVIGTWTHSAVCRNPRCRAGSELVPPYTIEWDPGSDRVGDFTWASFTKPVIGELVFHELQVRFRGLVCHPVRMFQNPRLKQPTRRTKRTTRRVWLPYEGPQLYLLGATTWVHMDPARTTARLAAHCENCGLKRYELTGVEISEHRAEVIQVGQQYDLRQHRVHVPREPGHGLYVRAVDVGNSDFFGVHEFPSWVFCTDAAKRFIQDQGYTNVAFLERGEIV